MKILVTGGAGFIGSALVRYLIQHTNHQVLNIDKLTYAGNLAALDSVSDHRHYQFKQIDITSEAIKTIVWDSQPDAIMHLAAESHVDKSLLGPAVFIRSNILGTFSLLEAARQYWEKLPQARKSAFRFLHVSTDEVFGDLGFNDTLFHENTAYAPSSPYSASKASADHLVRAWHKSFGLPVLITNCSNNYGPWQYPEKLIPKMILSALSGKPLPIYGSGTQIRDWLYVDDHVRALYRVLTEALPGSTYNIGGHTEKQNIEIVHFICDLLEKLAPNKPKGVHRYADLITHVTDRAGHDHRYAIDASKIQKELGFVPEESFEMAMQKTILWYLEHQNTFIRKQQFEVST